MNRILITEDNVQDIVEGLKKFFYMKHCRLLHHIMHFPESFYGADPTRKDILFNLEVSTFEGSSTDSGTGVVIRTGYGRGVSFHADGKTTIQFLNNEIMIHTPFDKIGDVQRYIVYCFQINNN